ncbi:MAG: hypothetical protein O7D86_02630 [Proteobacteria bacterium]|nr:hypothetical protein [Pseudomonadota bacterium]
MEAILASLLKELKQAYDKSEIRQYCLKNGHEWHYDLITTTMVPGGPLILGFNWGASQDETYDPQYFVKKSNFYSENVGSLSRIFPYCEKYFGNDFLSKASQSNYCFFRSRYERQISNKDIELCEPIFEILISTIQPSSILCLSSKLRDYLLSNDRISDIHSKEIKYKKGSSDVTYTAITGSMSDIEIKFLPHPSYPMKGEARSAAWEFCCGNV